MRLCSTSLLILALGWRLAASQGSGVEGVWRGESVCATHASACHDESVIYYINDVPDRPDLVFIKADKIVDGKAITMGSGQWQYDRAQHTLEWRMPQQVWRLKISDDRMEGTLSRVDGTTFRTMILKKDK